MSTELRDVIFSFSKPALGSTVVSNHLARFLAKTLQLEVVWSAEGLHEYRRHIRTLFIVNGAFAFCDCLPALGDAVQDAERIVWVQNDYTIKPPIVTPGAESPFRKAFQLRHRAGLPPVDYWTTVEKNATATPRSFYINWNQMTYPKRPRLVDENAGDTMLYYGAFRQNRLDAFDRYFRKPAVPTVISSTSKKFQQYTHPLITLEGGFTRGSFYDRLNTHGLGLYLEDKRSHTEYHSPANRFYEMLGAGLPMAFDPPTAPMLECAGYNVERYVIESRGCIRLMLKHRRRIAERQYDDWGRPYRGILRGIVRTAYTHYTENI